MIQLFRQNNIFSSFLLIPYAFIIRICFFWSNNAPVNTITDGALYSYLLRAFDEHPNSQFTVISICIGFSAVLINRLLIKNKLNKAQTLLPGLLYVLLASWLSTYLNFSSIHFANYFLILALLSLFSYSRKKPYTPSSFDASFYLSLSVLFYTPYILFFLPVLIGFFSLERVKFNDFLSISAGLITPFLIYWQLLFILGEPMDFSDTFGFEFALPSLITNWNALNITTTVFYSLSIAIALGSYVMLVRKNNIQVQKKFNIIYWILLVAFVIFIFNPDKNLIHFLVFSIPLGALLGMLWTGSRNVIWEELLHVLAIAGIIYMQYNNIFSL